MLIYTTGVNLRFEGLFALIWCKFDCNAADTNLVLIYTTGVNLRLERLFALIWCKFNCNAVDTNLVLIYTTGVSLQKFHIRFHIVELKHFTCKNFTWEMISHVKFSYV